jgi:hypothetical protein
MLGDSSFLASPAPRLSKEQRQRLKKRRAHPSPARSVAGKEKPTPRSVSKPVGPQPKEFRVRLRITTISEKEVAVQATTKKEAKEKAQAAVESEGDVRVTDIHET